MDCPGICGQELALRLKTCIYIPELGGEHESSERLDAARIYGQWVLLRAGEKGLLQLASVVQRALAWVELGLGSDGQQSRGSGT